MPIRIVQKLVLIGDYGVGKSSIFRRFVSDSFVGTTTRASSMGLDHYEKTYNVDGQELILQLWDTGGMERVASVTSSYFKHADAVLLCFSYSALDSFNNLGNHLLEVLASADNAKLYVCGNQSDMKNDMGPNETHIEAFKRENQINESESMFRAFYSTSCKSGDGQSVHDMFAAIAADLAVSHRPQPPQQDLFRIRPLSIDSLDKKKSSCCSGGNKSP